MSTDTTTAADEEEDMDTRVSTRGDFLGTIVLVIVSSFPH
jgi:hypothetical protein